MPKFSVRLFLALALLSCCLFSCREVAESKIEQNDQEFAKVIAFQVKQDGLALFGINLADRAEKVDSFDVQLGDLTYQVNWMNNQWRTETVGPFQDLLNLQVMTIF